MARAPGAIESDLGPLIPKPIAACHWPAREFAGSLSRTTPKLFACVSVPDPPAEPGALASGERLPGLGRVPRCRAAPAAGRFRNRCRAPAGRRRAAPGRGRRRACARSVVAGCVPSSFHSGSPLLTGSGRPVRSRNVASWPMPSRWKIVAVRSCGCDAVARPGSRRSCRSSHTPARRGCRRRPRRS